MKKAFLTALALALVVSPALAEGVRISFSPAEWTTIYLSPNGGAQTALVAAIGRARKQVLVQAYSFTAIEVERALAAAARRGVDVRAVYDKGQANPRASLSDELRAVGVPTRYDRKHAIAHQKVMIIDGLETVFGSYNFSEAAERNNSENMQIFHSARMAKVFAAEWAEHWGHSE